MIEFTGDVHPAAAAFPLLEGDDLKALADDIAANGQRHPILLDDTGRLLDGRNRLAACDLAGVDPVFDIYEGDDAQGLVISLNVTRRHMTTSEKAMAAARMAPDGRAVSGKSARYVADRFSISERTVKMARALISEAPDLASRVDAKAESVAAAYEVLKERRTIGNSTEAKMAKLRSEAPDFADAVAEERMTLAEALGAAEARSREYAEKQRDALSLLRRIVDLTVPGSSPEGFVADWANYLIGEVDQRTVDRLDDAIQILTTLRKRVAQ